MRVRNCPRKFKTNYSFSKIDSKIFHHVWSQKVDISRELFMEKVFKTLKFVVRGYE